MSVRSFIDTSVLIYTDYKDSPAKQRQALALLAEHRRERTGVLSIQVLQECFAAATRKLRLDAAVARRKVELFAEFDVAKMDVHDVLGAVDLHRLHRISFWDALILRAATQAGCGVLLTENMQDARSFDGIHIVSPFK